MAMVTRSRPTAPAEQWVLLTAVSWDTYERLLADHADRGTPRFTYDRGELAIVSPGLKHERATGTLALLVELVAGAHSIPVLNAGSMTYKRGTLQQGFESDASFYVRNEPAVRNQDEIDAEVDPPPDLVIEVDVSHPSLDKLPLFARMGVPEVWRFIGDRLVIFVRDGDAYRESAQSHALPPLTSDIVTRFMAESRSLSRPDWIRTVTAWAAVQ